MSVALLDVNVLVALLWKPHDHHPVALRWFVRHQSAGWATCPFTQAGYVRVISNSKVFPNAPGPAQAVDLLKQFVEGNSHHRFWADSLSMTNIEDDLRMRLTGHKQVTDAYLLALATHHKGKLVTLDRRSLQLAPEGSTERAALEILQ